MLHCKISFSFFKLFDFWEMKNDFCIESIPIQRCKQTSGLYYTLLNLKRYNSVHYWIYPSILAIKAKAGLTLCLWPCVC